MNLSVLSSTAAFIGILGALFMAIRYPLVASVFFCVANPLWGWFAICTSNHPLLIQCVVLTIISVVGVFKWGASNLETRRLRRLSSSQVPAGA